MPGSLSIAVAQPSVSSDDVAGNAVRHAAAIRDAGTRVVVFPELSLTGYELDAPVVEVADPRLWPIIEACGATGARALVGAPVVGDRGGDAIGMLAVDGEGVRIAYRKMWLGDGEAHRFGAGAEPTAIEVDGCRLGLAICKDTGVSAHAHATAELGIDVYVAGALEHDRDRAEQPARARRIAREHGVWVAVASFAGPTGGGYVCTAGRSAIWRPDGTVVASAGSGADEIAAATVIPR